MGKGWKTRNNLNNNEISELPPESYTTPSVNVDASTRLKKFAPYSLDGNGLCTTLVNE